MSKTAFFLPYQQRWLADNSRIKIWEKSRRIGATYVQSYEDVRDCVRKTVPSVWFTSADESAAREYIEYSQVWAKMFNVAAESMGLQVIDDKKGIQAYIIRYANGTKQYALSSNPKAFRSKGGKVVWDEAAWHDNPEIMWAAARPVITWGFPLRILSTHNGENSFFNRQIKKIKKGTLNWSLHTTDIFTAAEEGLVAKILNRETVSPEEVKAWLEKEHQDCADENTWLQEFRCKPVDETTAFLPYVLIESVERDGLLCELDDVADDFYVGVDIGRKKDLTVIWGLEKSGLAKYTRVLKVMERAKFSTQRDELFRILNHRTLRRCCIDATGLGMQLAEEAQDEFGKSRVEAINFTAAVKEELAYDLRTEFEDRSTLIPGAPEIREDLHAVRKTTTSAGNIRFDVAATEQITGHADRFWALALAIHAAKTRSVGPLEVRTRKRRRIRDTLRRY